METHRNCSNCGGQIDTDVKHCPHCGQKQPLADLSFSALVSDLWLVMTNIDNSFFRTLKDIWMPWKLTARYINGQRRKYINPLRLFIILLLIYVGLMVSLINFDNVDFFKRFTDYKSIKTIHTGIAEVEAKFPGNEDIFEKIDSIFIKNDYLVEGDTLFNFKIVNRVYIFNMDDVLNKDLESLYEKYQVTEFYEKVIYKQTQKALRDPLGAMRFIFGNLTWTIILCILMLAAFFKLLYFRQNKLFAEHLVLLCNIHSLSFFINIFLLLAGKKMSVDIDYLTYMLVFPPIIFLLSVKKYYNNGIMLTVFKSFIAGLTYFLSFALFIVLVSLISFFIF